MRRAGERGVWLAILRRGLRWRLGAALTLFAVGVVAVAGAAIGPIYLRSADDSTVTAALGQASLGATNLSVTTTGGSSALARVTSAVNAGHDLGGGNWFARPVVTVDADVAVDGATSGYHADLLARTNVCDHVRLLSGRCPTGAGQVVMSRRSAALSGLHLGQTIRLGRLGSTVRLPFHLVGIYQQPGSLSTTYWNAENYFLFGSSHPRQPIPLDAVFASQSTVLSITGVKVEPQETGFVSLRPGAIRSDDIGRLDSALRTFTQVSADHDHVAVTSDLPGVLRQASAGERTLRTIVESISLQLLVLALLVLYALIRASTHERRRDTAIARRRGFTRGALLTVAVGEPIALVAAALPVGLLVAWLVVIALGSGTFISGTPIEIPWSAVAVAFVALAGAGLAAVAGTWELWRGVDRAVELNARSRAASAAVDAVGVALAVTGLLALTAPQSLGVASANPLAMLAPLFAAIGLGLIGLRLTSVLMRVAVRATRNSPRISWFLAVRELARRRPSNLRQLLPVTAAVVLVILTVNEWAVADHNRTTVATTQVGAARVVDVTVPAGVDLATAVERADPSGRQAMAAAIDRSSSGNLLAVQAARLPAVASWPGALSSQPVARIAHYLAPTVSRPIEFVAWRLRVVASISPGAPPTSMGATVFNEQSQAEVTVSLGRLRTRPRAFTAALAGACATTCRLVDLSPVTVSQRHPGSGPVVLHLASMAVQPTPTDRSWQPIPLRASTPGSWTARPSSTSVSETGGELDVTVPTVDLQTQGTVLAPADVPGLIPAVVTSQLATASAPDVATNAIALPGLDGESLNIAADVRVPALPEIGANAAMINFRFAQLAQTTQLDGTARYQVWLSANASPTILQRLRKEGIRSTGQTSAVERLAESSRSPAALGYTLVLSDAAAAALLAVGVAGAIVASSRRRRRRELQQLVVVGISASVSRRSIWYEITTALAVTLLVGAAVGVGVSRLTVASLPQFTGGTGGIPVSHSLPLHVVGSVLAGIVVVLLLIAASAAAAVRGSGGHDFGLSGGSS